ncbi:MAG TPA: DUF1588 domain-containing protein, partial [Polyangiaceae bacterium]|nr:DUF1588 domain-containing protein [Polyangiaceae bacterium]
MTHRWLYATAVVVAACASEPGAANGTGGTAGASGASTGGLASASGGVSGGSSEPDPDELLPARVRRLATAEYDASVQALLTTEQAIATGADFPPDLRQDGFTVNGAQRVDAVSVERFADAADALATEAQQNGTLARLAPCERDADPASCARTFIETFGAKVYRRPLLAEEVDALLALYAVGAEDATYEDGITHVTRGLLQSAGFLYLTELGDGAPSTSGVVRMTPYELASELSYFVTSAPPDDELLAQAESGALSDPSERSAQARRLFRTDPRAQATAVRLVREWLGIDRIDASAKDSLIYPDFEAQKPRIVAESQDFVRAVTFQSTGTVAELIGARWTVDTGPLGMYQAGARGPIAGSTLIDRVGILNQAAFLATYANAHESHPIFRGVAITRRVVCQHLDSPASFNLQVVPPPPDPSKTTRERYEVHAKDGLCAGCHDMIDPFGFAFEHFDGMGAYRAKEHGRDVDSTVFVNLEGDY